MQILPPLSRSSDGAAFHADWMHVDGGGPASIELDEFKSAKWDELTEDRCFQMPDVPTMSQIRQWHKIAAQAMDKLEV